ncbi:MAG TPA: hypothetical protein VII45_05330 [Solirubrobacterales bacterium]
MRRASLIAVSVVACSLVALTGGVAAAKTPAQACSTTSENVVGKLVKGTLTSSNVNSVQASFATCSHAKKVMRKTTSLRVEEPKSVAAFYCVPTVLATGPDVVKYVCTFKGADTAMFVKLVFKVKYNLD